VNIFETDYYALERDLIFITNEMTENGFPLNVPAAQGLLAELETRGADVAAELQIALPPREIVTEFWPKVNNKTKGYIKGELFLKRTIEPFNPNSGPQFAERMIDLHGWVPRIMTEGGAPAVNAKVLGTLAFPEAALLLQHKTIAKRVTMLTGEKGLLTTVGGDGCLHTSYRTLGTVTGRASHSPNVAQVPKVLRGKDGAILKGTDGAWGFEFRSLFGPPPGWLLVGSDMAGLELRCLAHALFPWDGGAFAVLVCNGDVHSTNQAAAGLASRETAKTLAYAIIYGAGDYRAGTIIDPDGDDEFHVRQIGAAAKQRLISGIPGFRDLFRWLDAFNSSEIPGLDGRPLFARKPHTRLNTMLQAMGSILCKRWIVMIGEELDRRGLIQGHNGDFMWMAWVHDEVIIAARTPQIAEIVAEVCKAAAVAAGAYYSFNCAIAAGSAVGQTWADIH
jgi:DNA polymerase-1